MHWCSFYQDRLGTNTGKLSFKRRLYTTGYYDKQVAGVFISNSQRINASHNMIRNVPRAGILMNDGLVGGHDIAYNSVWNSVRDTSDHVSENR